MPIHVLREKATPEQVREMLVEHGTFIKIVVDLHQRILTGGGDMHYEGEGILLDTMGSKQADLWGANWYPDRQFIEFESLINIRPSQGNRSMILQDAELQQQLEAITREYLEGVMP